MDCKFTVTPSTHIPALMVHCTLPRCPSAPLDSVLAQDWHPAHQVLGFHLASYYSQKLPRTSLYSWKPLLALQLCSHCRFIILYFTGMWQTHKEYTNKILAVTKTEYPMLSPPLLIHPAVSWCAYPLRGRMHPAMRLGIRILQLKIASLLENKRNGAL